MSSRLRGSMVALVTPFRDGAVDEAALRALARWQIEKGTSGLVPCGTTGEGATVTADEHFRIVRACAEEARGRVPVIAGCGSNDTRKTIENVQRAKEAGADAALVVTPYYNKPTPEGLFRHFDAFFAGDLAKAQRAQSRFVNLVKAMFCETNPMPVKHALYRMGRISPELRLPLVPISQSGAIRVEAAMREYGGLL